MYRQPFEVSHFVQVTTCGTRPMVTSATYCNWLMRHSLILIYPTTTQLIAEIVRRPSSAHTMLFEYFNDLSSPSGFFHIRSRGKGTESGNNRCTVVFRTARYPADCFHCRLHCTLALSEFFQATDC